jgi:hypothetical protein
MEVWLYDENFYPRGFAGGHVPAKMPESFNQGQGLALQKRGPARFSCIARAITLKTSRAGAIQWSRTIPATAPDRRHPVPGIFSDEPNINPPDVKDLAPVAGLFIWLASGRLAYPKSAVIHRIRVHPRP